MRSIVCCQEKLNGLSLETANEAMIKMGDGMHCTHAARHKDNGDATN